MKKELIALSVLVLLFAGSLVNTHFLDKLTGEIVSYIEESARHIDWQDWEKARVMAEKAYKRWESGSAYTQIVLRHVEIDAASSTLSELLKEVYSENAGAAKAAAKTASARLKSVAEIERVRPGSIL